MSDEGRERLWLVEVSLGGHLLNFVAKNASFEGGSLVLYDGDMFGERDVVAAFGPGGWTFAQPVDTEPEEEE